MKIYGYGDNRDFTYVPKMTYSGLVNGVNTSYTLAFGIISGTEEIFADGVFLDVSSYSISGSVLTIPIAPVTTLVINGHIPNA